MAADPDVASSGSMGPNVFPLAFSTFTLTGDQIPMNKFSNLLFVTLTLFNSVLPQPENSGATAIPEEVEAVPMSADKNKQLSTETFENSVMKRIPLPAVPEVPSGTFPIFLKSTNLTVKPDDAPSYTQIPPFIFASFVSVNFWKVVPLALTVNTGFIELVVAWIIVVDASNPLNVRLALFTVICSV
jgi:hypothetical protein